MDGDVVPAPARKFIKRHQLFVLFLVLVALGASLVGVYYYNQYNRLNNILKNPNVEVQKETKQLVSQVGKLMLLPPDETPTVATVTDASRLKDQPFFKNAVNGDKVLIYVKAKKAILYDPAKNIIVDVAPVNIAQNQPGTTVSATPSLQQNSVQAVPTSTYVLPPTVVTPTPTK